VEVPLATPTILFPFHFVTLASFLRGWTDPTIERDMIKGLQTILVLMAVFLGVRFGYTTYMSAAAPSLFESESGGGNLSIFGIDKRYVRGMREGVCVESVQDDTQECLGVSTDKCRSIYDEVISACLSATVKRYLPPNSGTRIQHVQGHLRRCAFKSVYRKVNPSRSQSFCLFRDSRWSAYAMSPLFNLESVAKSYATYDSNLPTLVEQGIEECKNGCEACMVVAHRFRKMPNHNVRQVFARAFFDENCDNECPQACGYSRSPSMR